MEAARAADEDIEYVVEHGGRGNGIGIGRGSRRHRRERCGLRCGVLPRDCRLKLKPRRDEPVAGGPRRALPHEPDDLLRSGHGLKLLGLGPRQFAHQPIEMIPVEIPLQFQRRLFGHHSREDFRRRDGVLAGHGLVEKPAVELPRLERLPQVEPAAREERIDVVVALQMADQDLVKLGRHLAAGLVGRCGRDVPLVERRGRLQVARRRSRVGCSKEQRGRGRGISREPRLRGDLGRVGVGTPARLPEKLDHLWLRCVGGELRQVGRVGRRYEASEVEKGDEQF